MDNMEAFSFRWRAIAYRLVLFLLVLAIIAPFSQANEVSQSDAADALKYTVKVKVIYFENSKWKLDELQQKYLQVQNFFSQCELFLDVEFVKSSHQFKVPKIFPGNEATASSEKFAESLANLKNTVYVIHVDELIAEDQQPVDGISGPKARYGSSHSLVHKNWVAYPNEITASLKSTGEGLIEAHELAHDLFDQDHIDISGNILTQYLPVLKVSQQQCNSLVNHPKVKILQSELEE